MRRNRHFGDEMEVVGGKDFTNFTNCSVTPPDTSRPNQLGTDRALALARRGDANFARCGPERSFGSSEGANGRETGSTCHGSIAQFIRPLFASTFFTALATPQSAAPCFAAARASAAPGHGFRVPG